MKIGHGASPFWKKIPYTAIGLALVIAAMLALFFVNTRNSRQSIPPIFPEVYFEGEYRIGQGDWQSVRKGQHIPANQGDVTLRGQFHLNSPDGEYLGPAEADTLLTFYVNHIHLTVEEQGQSPYHLDIEYEAAGNELCGELYSAYCLTTAEPVTLIFHNPHLYGNERAIDEFLQELSIYGGLEYEKKIMSQGSLERNVGLAFVIAAFALLGTALFSTLLHSENSGGLWLMSLCSFFAGSYFVYGSKGIAFWSDSIVGNTTLLGASMMLYMLCVCALIVSIFSPQRRKAGILTVAVLAAFCAAVPLLCAFTSLHFYDFWLWWALLQSAVNILLFVCLILESKGVTKGRLATNIGAIVLLVGFEVDVIATALGWWRGGMVSRYVFAGLFITAVVLAWQIIPKNINASRKAKELEAQQKIIHAQLQESRMAITISQIQPHFIYNTLGTIQYLCKEDPHRAAQLVQRFSVYLRGNFSELDNTVPIRFTQELEHVRCYTDIELVRFPDMAVRYDIQAEDFLLPALTVQPLVENAIKHGLMGLEEGGAVTIRAYETDTHYCVEVIDDGVGFDTNAPMDKKQHIGIRNVQERLQVMCDGSLTVESQPGKGTTALIQIPKEEKEA